MSILRMQGDIHEAELCLEFASQKTSLGARSCDIEIVVSYIILSRTTMAHGFGLGSHCATTVCLDLLPKLAMLFSGPDSRAILVPKLKQGTCPQITMHTVGPLAFIAAYTHIEIQMHLLIRMHTSIFYMDPPVRQSTWAGRPPWLVPCRV